MVEELLSPLLTTIWGRRAGLLLTIVMSLLVFVTLVNMVVSWHSDFKLTRSSTDTTHIRVETSNQLNKQIAEIPERHLFGKYGVIEQSALLPVTSLQIRLVGVIKSAPENFSRVIISESNQSGKLYKEGDILPSTGVKIYAITQDGVILNNSGRLEKLPLQRT